jgi:hypothetical protein
VPIAALKEVRAIGGKPAQQVDLPHDNSTKKGGAPPSGQRERPSPPLLLLAVLVSRERQHFVGAHTSALGRPTTTRCQLA